MVIAPVNLVDANVTCLISLTYESGAENSVFTIFCINVINAPRINIEFSQLSDFVGSKEKKEHLVMKLCLYFCNSFARNLNHAS